MIKAFNIVILLYLVGCSANPEKENKADKEYEDIWIETTGGLPDFLYFNTKDSICESWGINYELNALGCEITEEQDEQNDFFNRQSSRYFKKINQKLGKNWKDSLEKEITKIIGEY